MGTQRKFAFSFIATRKASTMMVAVITPGLLIAFLGVNFYSIPFGTGDRTIFLITNVLTEVMFLVILTNFVPMAKNIPKLGYLFLLYTALLVSITGAVLVFENHIKRLKINLKHRKKRGGRCRE